MILAVNPSKKVYLALIFPSLVLLVFGTIFDLQISVALVDSHSLWAGFLADFGELPGYLLIYIAFLLYLPVSDNSSYQKKQIWAITQIAVGTIIVYILIYKYIGFFISIDSSLLIYPLFGVPCLLLNIFLVRYPFPRENFQALSKFILLLAIICPLLIVQTLKILWGRVRFRDLFSDYSNYSIWIFPQGITGNKSFPSGHSAMAWMLLPLLNFNKFNKFGRFALLFLTIIWGILVSFSRIIIGAHYLTDVVFSTIISVIISYILHKKSFNQR